MKHVLKTKVASGKPVKQWYQSLGSQPWETPTTGFKSGRYLLRETPKRVYQWSGRRKTISPKAKQMLAQQVLDNEEYNASRKEKGVVSDEKKTTASKREKRARCYICKKRGHTYWMCENKGKLKDVEKQHEDDTDNHGTAEEVRYPAEVHIMADYLVEGSDYKTWDQIWYVSHNFDFHMCPRRELFIDLQYKFKMVGIEENQRMFIFSYGLGSAKVETHDSEIVIGNIQYTPEVTMNILSYNLLKEQGFTLQTDGNTCKIKYMYEEGPSCVRMESTNDLIWGPKQAIIEHNKYLEDYFASLDSSTEEKLVKGLEDLSWNKMDTQDYVDDEYISWNGELYALKVNSYNRFISFMNLVQKDEVVFRNWAVMSKRFEEVIKWFYLVYLNYDMLEALPPKIGVIKIDLLCLHKAVAGLGGYVSTTLGNKWGTIAQMQGLTWEDGQAVRECYKKFIDIMVVYHETARVPWGEMQNEVGESSGVAGLPCQKEVAVRDDGRDAMNSPQVKVKIEEESSEGNNDFDIIV